MLKFTNYFTIFDTLLFYGMRIGVIGATGFVGQVFCDLAEGAGHSVVCYSRKERRDGSNRDWRVFGDALDLSNLDAIVNFAGETVAQRWSESKKKCFYESRVGVTSQIVHAISLLPDSERPEVLLNASAVGYYGDSGNQVLDEGSPKGGGFLSDLCLAWESESLKAEAYGVRVVCGRIGIVLGKGGKAWEQMVGVFKSGLGGPLGSGSHWMPWVHVMDVAGASLHVLESCGLGGVVNFVSPQPLTNKSFTKALAQKLGRIAVLPAPAWALGCVFGQFGRHLLDSYRVYPRVLTTSGYDFYYPDLQCCLGDLV